MKFIKLLAFIFFVAVCSGSSAFQRQTVFLEISKFVDGESFWVKNPNGKEEKIRFIGMNAPRSTNSGRTKIEYFGTEPSAYVKRPTTGKKVRLEYEVQRYDRYQRILAYIYLEDGTFLNAHLVEEGFAPAATYPPDVKHDELSAELERKARNERKGLWGTQ